MNFKYLDELIHSGKEEIIIDSDIVLKEGDERINLDIDNMTIDGNGHTIDAQNLTELFYSTAKNITLKDITIKNSLGAIYNEEGEISIMNSRFVQNESKTNGGAVLNYKGKMSIKASEFIENSANLGGAINNYRAILTVEDCIFTKNHAKHYGGAIYSDGNDFNLITSRLNQNTASIGGAIYVNMGEANIIESTLCQNSARVGGAIHNWNILNIKESAIDQNTADEYGGAIHNFDGEVFIESSTIRENVAKKGDGIFTNNSYELKDCTIEDDVHEIASLFKK